VQFAGSGVVPDPAAGGWQLNGAASLVSPAVQLTPATTNAAGSAFWPTAVASGTLTAQFTATIDSGTGADGLAFVLADAASTTPRSLGTYGGGLGFAGIAGVAVALDTFKGAGDPSANFVGLTDGRDATTGGLHWLATSTAVSTLRGASHVVKVGVANGTLTVWIDGGQVLQRAVMVPPRVLVGLSGATGGLTDRHAVSSFLVTGSGGGPAPGTLASDAFSRSVSGGWGSAAVGGAWSLIGSASAFAVDGAAGTQRATVAGQTRESDLAISVRDVDVTARLRVSALPVGSSQYAYVVLRRTSAGDAYRAKLRLSPDGRVYATFTRGTNGAEADVAPERVVSGLTPAANGWIRLHVQATGSSPTTLRLNAWRDGSSEPAGWAVSLTDSTAARQVAGGVGLCTYADTGITNAPITFSWDDLSVTGS
jgi:hypothetical protein